MMPAYRVVLRDQARHDLEMLALGNRKLAAQVATKIASLSTNPKPMGVQKLSNRTNEYRVRVRDVRILYEIHDEVLVVTVLTIAHRREVYR